MSDQVKIPRATLKRLPLYYRFVSSLKSKGIDRVNSKRLAMRYKLTRQQFVVTFHILAN